MRIRTGTTSSKTELGSVSSSTAPVRPPTNDPAAEDRHPPLLAPQLAAVAERAADRAEHEPDGVAHVGDDRRVAEGEQRGEGHERAGAHDGVDRPATSPAARMRSASRNDMCVDHREESGASKEAGRGAPRRLRAVLSRTGIVRPPCPTRSHPSTGRSSSSCTHPSALALYVRDMLPSMMGIFVSRGQARGEVAPPGTDAAAGAVTHRRAPEGRRQHRHGTGAATSGVGFAKDAASGSVGVAKDVAGGGVGLARDVAGTAIEGCSSGATTMPPCSGRAHCHAGSPRPRRRRARPPRIRAGPETRNGEPVADAPAVDDAADPRLRRAVRVAGGRAARRPRPRLTRRDPRATKPRHRRRNTILGKIAQLG